MWRYYDTVKTLAEALALLAEYGEQARVVAGGTDILLELERRVRPQVEVLVDITRVPDLDEITLDAEGRVHLGPLVTHNQCVASDLIRRCARPLAQACWEVGAPQIRNRATVVGNLVTASPANDSITALMALRAVVTLRSCRGERSVPLREFYTGVRRTVMAPDELMTDIAFPAMRANERGIFIKLGLRKAQAISLVNVAVILQVEETETGPMAHDARLALGAVAPTIIRAEEAERLLEGRWLDEATLDQVAELAAQVVRPIDDVRAPAEYRREMARVLSRRALAAIRSGDTRGWLPDDPVMLWGDRRGGSAEAPSAAGRGGAARESAIVTAVNGRQYTVTGADSKTLLRLLREDLQLTGTKEGCAEGECGACTVLLDGAAVMSCLVPAPRAHEAKIITVEGLAVNGQLHPIQQAFVEAGAVQCGYCTPGLLMSGAKLLEERRRPSEWEVQQAIAGNLCRCTGYYKILDAFERAGHRYAGPDA
ncbi:MAG: FAD binding domain-containing protein [Ardenticatenaceae bacterium]|nr:FAD binding domain-containing protein [Ardenticatenaceae bacterium]